ncbi:nuclear transport factor 2 family protein [Paraburkholderia sp. GAS348]|uniref:nuclear transport factor 2 family protein n=1 Tax=Paraburkholderia sp. GAS348 TaxID=3035132 RepID=UPI003D2407FB
MPNDVNDYSVERLADRAAIQDVVFRWCRGIDRLDFDAIRAVFHPDAVDNHGAYVGGVNGLIEWIRERHRTIPFSMHRLGNMLIEFCGPDEALVETYCLAIQRYPANARASLVALAGDLGTNGSGEADLLIACRYIDRITRRSGAWRIQERTVVFDSTMLIDAPISGSAGLAQWETGRRDRSDALYRQLSAAGLSPC